MDRLINVSRRPPETFVPKAVGKTADEDVGKKNDSTVTRLVKLVPTEIVAGYVPLISAAEAITNDSQLQFKLACIAFFAGLVLTPLYLILVGKPRGTAQWLNVVIATIAFVLWAYLLGGPFAMNKMNQYLLVYDKRVAGFAVGLFTWAAALIPYERLAPEHRK
jgi:hypothetical protein